MKIRYKLPAEDVSKLITTPVTKANEVSSFDAAGADQRFSVAVAAFGQKLRGADADRRFRLRQDHGDCHCRAGNGPVRLQVRIPLAGAPCLGAGAETGSGDDGVPFDRGRSEAGA